jgi:polysaccharide pyruvyl transferase WcaK-like protein
MPRYFVSGLCMQGNKGGPALALSLVSVIRENIPDAEFIFSVPGNDMEWPFEQKCARKYGIEIVKNIGLRNVVPPFNFMHGRIEQFLRWWKALRKCDALIQVSAVCYVGPPSGPGTLMSMIGSARVHDFVFTKLAGRPMFAWTQSYGPFSSRIVRFFARLDLRQQKLIFCRGDDCRDEVKKLLPEANAISFPDVAVTLPFDRGWAEAYMSGKFSTTRPVVSLSPSAVMYSRCEIVNGNNQHVTQLSAIIKRLASMGFAVLLVPHTCRPSQPDPNVCDLSVSRLVSRAACDHNVMVVEEDLSPSELKSIISNTEFHIGARYHSIVAALSSCVPAISISWHPKYRDFMRSYGMDEYVLEEGNVEELIPALLARVDGNKSELRGMLKRYHEKVVEQSLENARQFCALLERTEYEVSGMRLV